jgi:VWFA-related protein
VKVVNAAALLAAFAAVAAPRAFAQDAAAPQPTVRPTFHSAAALVALNVTVQDRGARFVQGLQPSDFVVYDEGVKQNVEFFEAARVPVDLIVLIDTSTSMRDRLPLVQEAATGFLKTLRPGDRGAVVAFSNKVSVLQPLTGDEALLRQAVRSTAAAGTTSLNTAVYIALKEFGQAAQSAGEVRRQAIVLLSDGADTASMVSFDDVLGLARRMGVSIYTVSLQERMHSRAAAPHLDEEDADRTMKLLAKETGAQSFFPTPEALKGVYASIASELANQYSIGYIPANVATDGAFHRVNVQVVTRPQVFSRTRLGYIAAAINRLPMGAER